MYAVFKASTSQHAMLFQLKVDVVRVGCHGIATYVLAMWVANYNNGM